jgi:hypothetical protein
MALQMLCLRKPPFAIPTFLREEAPVPVLHWTGRHHLRSVVLVWGQLIRDTASRYGIPNNNNDTGGDRQCAPARRMNVKGGQQQREGTSS